MTESQLWHQKQHQHAQQQHQSTLNHEFLLYQTLVNEGKHTRILNLKRPVFNYTEKQLRDAAAAEVAQHIAEAEKSSKKCRLLDAGEKAKQNRDRNREHAKNTRLRKKAYVVKLKELVDSMTIHREVDLRERRALAEKINESHLIRKNMAYMVLSYRAANVQDREKWSAILDDNVVLTLPITPYRYFHHNEIKDHKRVLKGIDSVMMDTASLALMVECIDQGSDSWVGRIKLGQGCRLVFDVTSMVVGGDYVMAKFEKKTVCADSSDEHVYISLTGMMTCQFSSETNKIVNIDIVFDVMGLSQHLHAVGSLVSKYSFAPDTIESALQPSQEARAISVCDSQLSVVHINEAWTNATGCMQSQIERMSLWDTLQVVPSQHQQFDSLMSDCLRGMPLSSIFIKQNKDSMELMLLYLKMLPLTSNNSSISHILCIQVPLSLSSDEQAALRTQLHLH